MITEQFIILYVLHGFALFLQSHTHPVVSSVNWQFNVSVVKVLIAKFVRVKFWFCCGKS